MTATAQLPTWARWTASEPYSLGLEEEVMLLRPDDWTLAQAADALHASLPAELAAQATTETHNSALEIAGAPHRTVGAAVDEIAGLRARLGQALAARGLSGAVAGTHPWATWQDVEISAGERYAEVYRTMRELARREPTFALHVHVGVPDPERAVTLLRALRGHLPLLLALSANSPFWRGQDSGVASVRTSIFRMFPRVGIPRPFRSYGEYVGAVDAMIRCGAIPEPTFLWWDVRLQPRLGTVEVRVMDAQSSCWQTGALAALVQSIAHMELEGESPGGEEPAPEFLDENVFLAARDGLEAGLVSPHQSRPEPIGQVIDTLLDRLAPHAAELGCAGELAAVEELVRQGGGARSQRRIVEQRGPEALLPTLAGCFTAG